MFRGVCSCFVFVFELFLCFRLCVVFFFKQKTAYEMRISDWSSDVCSSDLLLEAAAVDLDAADGRVFIRGTDRSLSFREVARAVYSEMGRLPKELQEDRKSVV